MTTLIACADALVAKLRAAMPDIPVITADAPPQTQRALRVPAVYLEIDSIEPLQEAGDSRLLADLRWQARCLVDPNQPRADLLVRALAARVAVALHEIRRPIAGHGHIRLVQATDDAFRPEVDGYVVWVVEFSIEIALGELEPPGIPPSEIYVGIDPKIGAGHENDYEPLATG